MNVLENVLNSTYHSFMKISVIFPNDVKFNERNDNFFIKYNDLICELEQIAEDEYSKKNLFSRSYHIFGIMNFL
ncbi:hypothetical protein [Clostridium estertheticum]|nr:hypothetical protein [Clostridium estertheticum]WAG73005.1 hypothetical protein LL032_17905 [Clostridium estertheticum]